MKRKTHLICAIMLIVCLTTTCTVQALRTNNEENVASIKHENKDFFIGWIYSDDALSGWSVFRCLNVRHIVIEDGKIISYEHLIPRNSPIFIYNGVSFKGIIIPTRGGILYYICGYFY